MAAYINWRAVARLGVNGTWILDDPSCDELVDRADQWLIFKDNPPRTSYCKACNEYLHDWEDRPYYDNDHAYWVTEELDHLISQEHETNATLRQLANEK